MTRPYLPSCWPGILCLLMIVSPATARAGESEVQVPSFSCADKVLGIHFPARLSELRALGTIRSQKTVSRQRWDGYETVEQVLDFAGLSVQLVSFSHDAERYLLGAADVTGAAWSLGALRVGRPAPPAFAALGLGRQRSGLWRLSGETDSVYVELRDGRVRRFVYECYTG